MYYTCPSSVITQKSSRNLWVWILTKFFDCTFRNFGPIIKNLLIEQKSRISNWKSLLQMKNYQMLHWWNKTIQQYCHFLAFVDYQDSDVEINIYHFFNEVSFLSRNLNPTPHWQGPQRMPDSNENHPRFNRTSNKTLNKTTISILLLLYPKSHYQRIEFQFQTKRKAPL